MKVKPLQNETLPTSLVSRAQPDDSFPYKVQDGDTWESVAARNYKTARSLIWFNFKVDVDDRGATNVVNWYLREYVGCNVSLDNGRNWAFSSSADPGIIYIPNWSNCSPPSPH